jgi:enamidase
MDAQPLKLVVKNIGLLLTGKIEAPIADGDCIVAIDGKIAAIGYERDLDISGADTTIDAKGVTLAPGLIDSHVHPVVGDYTPRQQQLHWIDSTLHGGVTTMISAGEVHMPGRPKDVVGLKAMAIASQRWYENFRPSGMKVLAGAPVIEHGMVEQDFKDLADAGVKLLGEVGLGTVKDGKTREADGRLGQEVRHSIYHSHRWPLDPRIGPDRRRYGSGNRNRCRRAHQWRSLGLAR